MAEISMELDLRVYGGFTRQRKRLSGQAGGGLLLIIPRVYSLTWLSNEGTRQSKGLPHKTGSTSLLTGSPAVNGTSRSQPVRG